jgi:hypothetical protein
MQRLVAGEALHGGSLSELPKLGRNGSSAFVRRNPRIDLDTDFSLRGLSLFSAERLLHYLQ